MSKSDLQARPVYHRKRDSIEAHLTIEIRAGRQTITAADALPDDLRRALEAITRSSRDAH